MNHSAQTDAQSNHINQEPCLTDQQINDMFPIFSRQQSSSEIITRVA